MGYYDCVTIYDAKKIKKFIKEQELDCDWKDLFYGNTDTCKIKKRRYYIVVKIDDVDYDWREKHMVELTDEQDEKLDKCIVYDNQFHR